MFELTCLIILILFFCTSRTKRGLKKGVSDSLETGCFLILKGNEAARNEISDDFNAEFEKLIGEKPKKEKK